MVGLLCASGHWTANRPDNALPAVARMGYAPRMALPAPIIEDEDAAEAQALAAAIAVAEADPRRVPHDAVRPWLLRLAAGEFDAPPPQPC